MKRFGAGLGLTIGVLTAGVATAMPASAEPVLTIEVGADGRFRPDNPVPVAVTVTADRALRGKVVVNATLDNLPGSIAPTEIPVELAAGSTKEFVVVVPGATMRGPSGSSRDQRVRAALFDGDVSVAEGAGTVDFDEGIELVGVMPTLVPGGRLPDDLPLRQSDTGQAALAAVSIGQMDSGAGGGVLGPYGSIVTAPADLAALTPVARQALLEWLAAGGQLYVDAQSAPVPALPEEWQPRDGWADAGDGVVRLSRGEAQAGRWSFLEPTRAGWAYMDTGGGYFGGSASVAGVIGADAGLAIPQLGVLAGVAIVYILLIGPVSFFILARMQRRTLAWLTVPALSVLFTGVFAVAGARGRADSHPAHATVIELGPAGARARSVTLVGSAGGGRFDVTMPSGWRPAFDVQMGGSNRGTVPNQPLALEGGGVAAHLDLGPGEFRQVTALGALPDYGTPLRVRATSDGQKINGTVTNDLDVALHQVAVMVHNTTVVLGTVPARTERPFALTGALQSASVTAGPCMATPAVEAAFWPQKQPANSYMYNYSYYACPGPPAPCKGYCPPPVAPPPPASSDQAELVNIPMWSTYTAARPLPLRRAGAVNVVGWTRELPSPVTVTGGAPLTQGRTALVARAPLTPDPAAPYDSVGARFEQVRGTSMKDLDPGDDPVEAFVIGPVYRVIVPPGVPPDSIVIEPPLVYKRLAVSSAGGWKVTPEVTTPIRYRLAPEDVVDGVVYLQVRLPDSLGDSPHTDPYLGWRLRAAVPGEDVTPAVPATSVGGRP